MRNSQVTAKEIQDAEKAKDDRQKNRSKGFSLMEIRDLGGANLRNYAGGSVAIGWHVPEERRNEGMAYPSLPDGKFSLKVGKEFVVLDAEEFRKVFRWV